MQSHSLFKNTSESEPTATTGRTELSASHPQKEYQQINRFFELKNQTTLHKELKDICRFELATDTAFCTFTLKRTSQSTHAVKLRLSIHPDQFEKAWEQVLADGLLSPHSPFKMIKVANRSFFIRYVETCKAVISNKAYSTEQIAEAKIAMEADSRFLTGTQITLYLDDNLKEEERKTLVSFIQKITLQLQALAICPGETPNSDVGLETTSYFSASLQFDSANQYIDDLSIRSKLLMKNQFFLELNERLKKSQDSPSKALR